MPNVPDYYDSVRRDILHALPPNASRVLEIGCGTGATLSYLKEQGRYEWAGGVEFVPEIAEKAEPHLDRLWVGNIEHLNLDIADGSLDVILCLDVLEHLVDPWTVVSRLDRFLKPGGCMIASIPNVRYRKVVFPLLFRGEWTYQDYGVLDRTHLRFFVRRTAIELMVCSGLRVDLFEYLNTKRMRAGGLRWMLNILTGGEYREILSQQFLIRAIKET